LRLAPAAAGQQAGDEAGACTGAAETFLEGLLLVVVAGFGEVVDRRRERALHSRPRIAARAALALVDRVALVRFGEVDGDDLPLGVDRWRQEHPAAILRVLLAGDPLRRFVDDLDVLLAE